MFAVVAIYAGLRNSELRGLRGKDFERPGWIRISADTAKGGKGRPVPVPEELRPVVDEIKRNVAPEEYVLPAQRVRDVGINRDLFDRSKMPSSSQALRSLVRRVATRAGIAASIHPHLLRHVFADRIVRHAGLRDAQFLLGHGTVATTEIYLGRPTMDELRDAIAGFKFRSPDRTPVLGVLQTPNTPLEATTGIEPV